MRLNETLDQHRLAHPDREAVVCGSVRLNYTQLGERVDRLASGLRALELGKGARVAVLSRNCHRYLECYFGVPAAGAVLVPLNYRLAPRELTAILAESDASALLVDPQFLPTLEAIRGELPQLQHIIVLADEAPGGSVPYEQLLKRSAVSAARIFRDFDDLLYLYYTSGTTGQPKGVMLSERNIAFVIETCREFARFSPADRYLHTVSLGHRGDIVGSCG
jgi:acyl-CoA synthetase (AMP-forming)/AMP-acid ligase II